MQARRPRGWAIAVAAVIPLGISGCAAVGPNYQRPAMHPPAQYRFGPSPAEAQSLADLPWWQVFADPTLQALVREALMNNLDLRAAVARVEIARAQAGIAKSFLYPQIDGSASYTAHQSVGGAADTGDLQHGGIYGFQLSWELDIFGRIRREREAAVARMLASEQGRRAVLVTLVGDVAATYFQIRELDAELDVGRRTLAVNDQTVQYFQDRLDGGVSNRLEVDRIRANRAQTAATIPEVENRIAVAENSLSLLLGRPPGSIPRDPVSSESPMPPAIPAGLPAALLERRPDVVQAEQLLVASNADVGAAKALFFPAISLTGFLGGISGEVTSLLGNTTGGVWSIAPGLLQPVFNGGRLKHNLEAARAAVDEAVAQYRKAALNSYREVADALVTITKLTDIHAQRVIAVASLQDAADLARSRYQSGLASYIEILTADRDLFEQQLLLAQTKGAEYRARSDLYRALGGGWQP